MKSDYLITWQA